MGRKPRETTQNDFLNYLRSGRDELNILEHSFSGANKSPDKSTRSVEFKLEDRDPVTREKIDRSWKISFSAEYGRPTPKDDDVFLALITISADSNFAQRRVYFSRYQICQIHGWGGNGEDYKAIDNALSRLQGVHIVAKNYWYDNKAKIWKDRRFNLIDDSETYTKEKFDKARKAASGVTLKSWFVWSEVMQESFDSGYLRKLDLEEYRSLEHPISRKLFRYLGKHFWHKTKLKMELGELACEKLGYKKGTALSELRRALKPVFSELETKGIYNLKHRFEQSYGKCDVILTTPVKLSKKTKTESSPLFDRLTQIGLSAGDANAAIKQHTEDRIMDDIEDIEFREKNGGIKKSKSGLLSTMLKDDKPWERSTGFVSSNMKKQQQAKAEKRIAEKASEQKRKQEAVHEKEKANKARIANFLATLPNDEARSSFENQAVQDNPHVGQYYLQYKSEGGANYEAFRETLLLSAIEKLPSKKG